MDRVSSSSFERCLGFGLRCRVGTGEDPAFYEIDFDDRYEKIGINNGQYNE